MVGAPIEPSALEAALRPFGASTMLPAAAYVATDVLAWEQRHLFAGSWVALGRTALLAEAGNQHARTVGDVGVLVTFDDSTPRAFANVCRHRGHELLAAGAATDRPAVLCPYHGWSYGLDGRVRTAPRMGEGFDATAYGLIELPAVDWHGWLFVNATGTARPFAAHVGALAGHVAPYRPETLVIKARHEYEVAANWKVIAENYHECYHCPLIHPELCAVSPPNSGSNWREPGTWVGGSMDLRDHADTMSLDGRSHGIPLAGVEPRLVRYLGLFPNMLISLHPDYVLTHLLEPLSPGASRVTCEWLFPAEVTDPSYAVDFWDLTNRQDWAACESVQRGLSSPHFVPGPLAPNENAVYDWVTLIARAYRDPLAELST
ncbi:aromatic ring-hydroxylating oxygenase subunit alpha [Asanoa siamensis]|uniref:(2Fe-2S)-binding protein n=1 Tax=Asanoa siamensis TaxID=926357 RepID=A0ABQ4CS00_9ACTN|nr:aromatic ring-hydroxylating dioxygenase subunit alpha [Asanoa siamensis]GIF74071.1 (2Fe-2S)-binding protein [Asanoa siamensis]